MFLEVNLKLVRKSSDWRNVETKKLNALWDIHYTGALRDFYTLA